MTVLSSKLCELALHLYSIAFIKFLLLGSSLKAWYVGFSYSMCSATSDEQMDLVLNLVLMKDICGFT